MQILKDVEQYPDDYQYEQAERLGGRLLTVGVFNCSVNTEVFFSLNKYSDFHLFIDNDVVTCFSDYLKYCYIIGELTLYLLDIFNFFS